MIGVSAGPILTAFGQVPTAVAMPVGILSRKHDYKKKKKKKKAAERIEGAVKRTKSVKIPVINLDVYEKLKEIEEEAENEGDDQKLRDTTCVKKGLMWIEEADGGENSIELWARRMSLVHEVLSLA